MTCFLNDKSLVISNEFDKRDDCCPLHSDTCPVSETVYGFEDNQKLLFTFLITKGLYVFEKQNFPTSCPPFKNPNRLN